MDTVKALIRCLEEPRARRFPWPSNLTSCRLNEQSRCFIFPGTDKVDGMFRTT